MIHFCSSMVSFRVNKIARVVNNGSANKGAEKLGGKRDQLSQVYKLFIVGLLESIL